MKNKDKQAVMKLVGEVMRARDRADSDIPRAQRRFNIQRRWVRSFITKYLTLIDAFSGQGVSWNYSDKNHGVTGKIFTHSADAYNAVADFETALRSLAWTGTGKQETEKGIKIRKVFIDREIQGYNQRETATRNNMTLSQMQTAWENAIEEIWECLEDYRD